MNILETCQYYGALGFRALPASLAKKSPLGAWGIFRERPPTIAELAALSVGADAVCILTGNGVEVLDFDEEAVYGRWCQKIDADLLTRLLVERTQSGGHHVVYQCSIVEGNQKLAKDRIFVDGPGEWPTGYGSKKLKAKAHGEAWVIEPVLIETRGTGGLIICSPTEGYSWLSGGDLMDCPTVSPEEREIMLRAARSLSVVPVEEKPRGELSGKAPDLSNSPYPQDQYSWNVELDEIVEMLEEAGWTRVGEDEKRIRFARPGKEEGVSGTLTKDKAFTFWSFTDNGDLPTEQGLLAFDLAVVYRFDGDRAAALSWAEKQFPLRSIENLAPVEEEIISPPTSEEALVSWINESHALTTIGGKAIIIRETEDRLDLLRRYDFETLMLPHKILLPVQNAKGEWKDKAFPASKIWLESPDRRETKGICFSPSGCKEGWTNLWRGFAVSPSGGADGCKLYRRHVEDIVCGGEPRLIRYLWAWLADMLQNPGCKPGVCVVLQGGRGVGKGMFARPFMKILGRHAIQIHNKEMFIGRFNAHMADILFAFFDEAYWPGDKSAEGKLKGFITEPSIVIEQKGIDAFSIGSYHRCLMASNEEHVVPAGMDERRWCCIKVSDAMQQNHEYFSALDEEINNGGAEALLAWLLEYDYSDVNVRVAPGTKALNEQKLDSMPTHVAWWFECLQNGSISQINLGWPEKIKSSEVHGEYLAYCRLNNASKYTLTSRKLLREIFSEEGFCPKGAPKRVDSEERFYPIPNLENCRDIFCKKFRCNFQWD